VTGARLLIVEDDPALAQMLRLGFGELGYRVCLAGSCRQARRMLAETRFDLVLLDYHLPDGKGSELLEVCRSRQPEPAIILSSGHTDHEELERIAGRRCRFVPKPAAAETLDLVFRTLGRV